MKSIKEIRRENLEILIKEAGGRKAFTDKKEAEKLNITYGFIGLLLNGHSDIGDKVALKLEQIGKKPKYWLDVQHQTQLGIATEQASTSPLRQGNTEPAPDISGRVPVVSWVKAGDWSEAIDQHEAGVADEWASYVGKMSDQSYALRVKGGSMEPTYPEDFLIFVDPNKQPEHNSDIVVRLHNANEAIFKRLKIEGGVKYLISLNSNYPDPVIPLDDEAIICGVVYFYGKSV